MVIFHSYVSLPEGKGLNPHEMTSNFDISAMFAVSFMPMIPMMGLIPGEMSKLDHVTLQKLNTSGWVV